MATLDWACASPMSHAAPQNGTSVRPAPDNALCTDAAVPMS